jgi:hypothetical protein
MRSKRTVFAVAAVLVLALLAVGGCKPNLPTPATSTATGSQTATPQASVEPTNALPLSTSGPITTPAAGSAERKALLDAARTKLESSSAFYVYQLYVQGDTAIGDIDPVAKGKLGRIFVAWERRNGEWVAIGASKFGSQSANAASTARALPSFSPELLSKIDWNLKKPTVASTTTSNLTEAQAKASLEKAAIGWSKTAMSGVGQPYTVTLVKVAEDSSGTWWGRVVTQPTKDASNSYEPLNFWAKYADGTWSGAVQDPEPPAPSTFFPSSVTAKLGF